MKIPKLCYHKASGQAYCRVRGKCRYLGRWGTPEADEGYREILKALAGEKHVPGKGTKDASTLTVTEALDAYELWAEDRYRHADGEPTSQIGRVKPALELFRVLYGAKMVARVSAGELDASRREMVRRDWNRGTIACAVSVLRRCWAWLVSRGKAPADALTAMKALEALRPGQWGVREPRKLTDVPEADYRAVLDHLRDASPTVARMISIQWHTGMRTEEVRVMRWEEITWEGEFPIYRPSRHKMSHRGQGREIILFPGAVAELGERKPVGLVFKSQRRNPWTAKTYSRVVMVACKAAKVVPWTPYQLRHTACTRFEKAYGWAVAARLLGHAPGSQITGRYVHQRVEDLMGLLKKAP